MGKRGLAVFVYRIGTEYTTSEGIAFDMTEGS
jgi:hypothetical protein